MKRGLHFWSMSLRWKMALQIGAMIIGLLLVSAASMWGLNGLHQDYDVALASYYELRQVYAEVGVPLATARELLRTSPEERGRAAEQLQQAIHKFDLFLRQPRSGPGEEARDEQAEAQLRAALVNAANQLGSPPGPSIEETARADSKAINDAYPAMATFATRIRQTIKARKDGAEQKDRDTIIAVGVLCAVVVFAGILLGFVQYRSVMLPLGKLAGGVRRIAAGQFKQRLDERGSREFAQLASEFNRMAAELDEFYHRLEQKVAEKSRELIRSERLASVGYLAAGVAHEINNPLGIIAGYAEYSLGELKQRPAATSDEELQKSLQVICDEAFRCKDIIGKLLSLARPGEGDRRPVDLGETAQQVAAAVGGLHGYRDRKLTVITDRHSDLHVEAVEGELKQVILNLMLNALEAVPSETGEVRIEVDRDNGWVDLHVRDNGRGMTAATLERIFEPFYTDKRGARQPGTGLGLSITHAIVESHGGRIRATSAGAGQGSEFIVQLPAAGQHQSQAATGERSVA